MLGLSAVLGRGGHRGKAGSAPETNQCWSVVGAGAIPGGAVPSTRFRPRGAIREGLEPFDQPEEVRHFGLAQFTALEGYQKDALALYLVGSEQRLDQTGMVELPVVVPGSLSMEEHGASGGRPDGICGRQSSEIVRPPGSG
jgi:hypothetical protein